MKYLIDSHVLLWSLYESQKLLPAHGEILESDATTFVSAATVWEVEIKKKLNKLPVPDAIWDQCRAAGHGFLVITPENAAAAGSLPLHHKDPFDRMLVAQAQIEGLSILTTDKNIMRYDVTCI